MSRDQLYTQDIPGDFEFNSQVAEVFSDMINRSVPCYSAIVANLPILARNYIKSHSNVYDLGCSLGAVTFALRQAVQRVNSDNTLKLLQQAEKDAAAEHLTLPTDLFKKPIEDVTFVAVDTSEPMLARAKNRLDAYHSDFKTEFVLGDITKLPITNASLVVMNFVLQFVEPAARQALLEKIYAGLNPGGVFVLSEKINLDDDWLNQEMIKLHHDFKRANGYSQLEIERKRTALENVMILDSQSQHIRRLEALGFKVMVWQQGFNFCSFLCYKPEA